MTEPPTIKVIGSAVINRQPERALLSFDVRSTGTDQAQVANNINSTANKVKQMLNDLMPTTGSGEATPDAPITHWSMSNLSSGTIERTSQENKIVTHFTSSTGFSVKFRDFDRLGTVISELAIVPCVEISNVSWMLTDATSASLASEVRLMAAQNAIERATDYAKAFGYEKVVPVKIEDRGSGLPSTTRASMMRERKTRLLAREEDTDTLEFSPEEVSLKSTVDVTFAAT